MSPENSARPEANRAGRTGRRWFVERTGLAKRIVNDLRRGRHCLLFGPPLVGKTPLLKYVAEQLNRAPDEGVAVGLCDFDVASQLPSWNAVVSRIGEDIAVSLGAAPLVASEDISLVSTVRAALNQHPGVEQLILLFDHVDHLPPDYLRRFAHACGALLNGPSGPLDRVVLLWCGDGAKLRASAASSTIFLRITRSYSVAGYSREETDGLVLQHAATMHGTLSDEDLGAIWEATGGHPVLVRCQGDRFGQRLFERFEDEPGPRRPLREVVTEETDRYATELLAAAWRRRERGKRVAPRFVERVADALVQRISSNSRLLDLMMAIALSTDGKARHPSFSHEARENRDLFDWDRDEKAASIRGQVLDQFLRSYFRLERIGWCYLLFGAQSGSFGKGVLCFECASARSTPATVSFQEPDRDIQDLLPALSSHMHRVGSSERILVDLLLTVAYVLGFRNCMVFEMEEGRSRQILDLRHRNGRPPDDPEDDERVSSFAMSEALRTGRACGQEAGSKVAVPITVGQRRSDFVLWVETDPEREDKPDVSLFESLASAVEGPLVSALDRETLMHELRRREEQVRLLSHIEPFAAESAKVLNDTATHVVNLFQELGYNASIHLRSSLFGESRVWPSSEGVELDQSHVTQAERSERGYWVVEREGGQTEYYLALRYLEQRLGVLRLRVRSDDVSALQLGSLSEFANIVSSSLFFAWEYGLGQVHRLMLDSLPIGVQVLDPEFRIVDMNRRLEDLLRGRDRFAGDWRGQRCWQVYRPESQTEQCTLCTAREAIEQGDAVRQVESWPHRTLGEKKTVWQCVISKPILQDGKHVGTVELMQPLTTGEVFEHLSAAEHLFEQTDPQRVKQLVVRGALMLGFDRARLYWQDPGTGLLMSSVWAGHGYDDRAEEFSHMELCLGPVDPKADAFEAISRGSAVLLRREGRRGGIIERAVVLERPRFSFEDELDSCDVDEVAVVPLEGPRGLLGALAVDYKYLGEQARFSNEDVEKLGGYASLAARLIHSTEMHAGLAQFINEAAHTLKQPVSNMQGAADLLFESTPKGVRESDLIEKIRANSRRATRLVKGIADFQWGRSEAGQGPSEEVDLVPLIGQAVAEFKPRAVVADVRIEVSSKSARAPILGDGDKLIFALQNLLANGLEATAGIRPPSGGHFLSIEIAEAGDQYEVRVRDSGCGIASSTRSRVWNFFSTKRGSGIGLPSTREIIRRHRGSIDIESPIAADELTQEPFGGTGTCFLIKLPKIGAAPNS